MKKIFTVLVLIMAIVNTSPLFAKNISTEAWDKLRILHRESLGISNNHTSHDETIDWISNEMLKWLNRQKNGYEATIKEYKATIKKHEATIKEYKAGKENLSIIKYYKIFSWIVSSILGIIVVMFIAFILIKKCQAKKLPQYIEDAIVSQD